MEGKVAGRYQLQGKLGEGGMAVVYRAEDTVLGRTVAVKMPRPSYAADPQFQRRFQREARTAASLSHPHIVSIFDVGESDGQPFLVMEYVEGSTLKELLRQRSLPIGQALEVAIQTCEAVAAAHALGIVHRDIKPQNILLKSQSSTSAEAERPAVAAWSHVSPPSVKLTDFGIARAVGSASISQTKQVMGSVHYLSPEQAMGKPASLASDIYSMGVVLYEMLAGRPPFEGETVVGIAMQHIQATPLSLRELNTQVTAELESVVQKAMAKEAARRYSSAEEMGRALREYLALGDSPTMAVPTLHDADADYGPGVPPAAGRDVPPERLYPVRPERVRQGGWPLYFQASLAFFVLMGMLVLVWQLFAGGPPTRPPATATTITTATASTPSLAAVKQEAPTVTPTPSPRAAPAPLPSSTATVTPVPSPSVGPVETISRFYALVNQRRYEELYVLMGAKIKGETPYARFLRLFENKLGIWAEESHPVSQQDAEAVVETVGWVSDRTETGIDTWRFRETWKLVVEENAWRLDTRLGTERLVTDAGPPFPTPTPCINRKYPEEDAAGNLFEVQQWCDGNYTRRQVRAIWGTNGSALGQFNSPRDVAVDAQGNVYVADRGNSRIQKLSPAGKPLAQWGTAGTGAGQFKDPLGVAVDADGNVYVADGGNNRIQKLSPAGKPLAQWGKQGTEPGEFKNPQDVTVDAQGNVYVADTGNNRIQKLSPSGKPVAQWGTAGAGTGPFKDPSGVAVDAQGNVYVADTRNHRIQKLSSSGRLLAQWDMPGSRPGQSGDPVSVMLDAQGNVYVADAQYNRIYKFSSSGKLLTQLGTAGAGPAQFRDPYGIAVDAQGNVYVADGGNHRIQKFWQASLP